MGGAHHAFRSREVASFDQRTLYFGILDIIVYAERLSDSG
jgi:hypothetical protein